MGERVYVHVYVRNSNSFFFVRFLAFVNRVSELFHSAATIPISLRIEKKKKKEHRTDNENARRSSTASVFEIA